MIAVVQFDAYAHGSRLGIAATRRNARAADIPFEAVRPRERDLHAE